MLFGIALCLKKRMQSESRQNMGGTWTRHRLTINRTEAERGANAIRLPSRLGVDLACLERDLEAIRATGEII